MWQMLYLYFLLLSVPFFIYPISLEHQVRSVQCAVTFSLARITSRLDSHQTSDGISSSDRMSRRMIEMCPRRIKGCKRAHRVAASSRKSNNRREISRRISMKTAHSRASDTNHSPHKSFAKARGPIFMEICRPAYIQLSRLLIFINL